MQEKKQQIMFKLVWSKGARFKSGRAQIFRLRSFKNCKTLG